MLVLLLLDVAGVVDDAVFDIKNIGAALLVIPALQPATGSVVGVGFGVSEEVSGRIGDVMSC